MVTETKVELTLEEKADILREHGVEVFMCVEPGSLEFIPFPTVFFEGDENEGHRALRILQERGIRIWHLNRCWRYEGQEELYVTHWELTF